MAKRQNGEGSFYKRADGLWVGRIMVAGKRHAVAAKTQGEARRKLQELRKAADDGLPLATSRQTVAEYLATWLEEAARPNIKPRTYHTYAETIRLHLTPGLGHHQLAKLAPQHVQAFLNERQAGRSPRTVLHMHAVLRVALGRAVKWGLVARNVALLVDPPKVPTAEIHPFTPEQARTLLAVAEGHRYEHLYALLVSTGLRLGEARALRWEDVDTEAGKLRVRHTLLWLTVREPWVLAEPKSERGRRVVPLIGPAVAALRAQRDRQMFERRGPGEAYTDHGFVFADPMGRPIGASAVERDLKALLAKAGLPLTHRPHDLRHTTATYLLAAGVPERVVMEILGHSNLAMTRHYEHVLSSVLVDAASRLESWMARPAR